MQTLKIIMVLLFLAISVSASKELVKFTLSSYILPNKDLSMELDVVTPRTPGHYPVMLFLTGLSGLAPSVFQQKLIDSVAEQGYVWMTISRLQSPNPEKITQTLSKAVDWINGNIQQVLNNRAPGVIADIKERLILMGHSAAGHVTNQYLNSTCGTVKLFIMLSPVDGVDPFGIKKNYIITPGKMLPFATPTLILAAGLDHTSRKLEPPCAPDDLSNNRFYNATSGPKWFLNATIYGHADFFNLEYKDVAAAICATCTRNCQFAAYRTFVKEMILSFSDAILKKDALALSYIEMAKFNIDLTYKHDYMGYDPMRGGFCERVNQKEQQLTQDQSQLKME